MCPESWHIMMMYSNDLGQNTNLSKVNFLQSFPSDNFDIWQNSHVKFPLLCHAVNSPVMFWLPKLSNSEATKNGSTKSRLGNLRRFFKHGSKSLGDVEVIATTTGWTLHYVKRCGPTFGAYWCWPGYRQVLPHRRWWPCFFVEICWKIGGKDDWNLIKESGRWFSHDKFSSFDVDVCSW